MKTICDNGILRIDFRLMQLLLLILFPATMAVDSSCNYYQKMDVGPKYYVYNKEYPSNYGPNQDCLWQAVAPLGYVVAAECQVEIPSSSTINCVEDRIKVSLSGQPNLEDGNEYCGYGNLSVESKENKISIGLQSSYSTKGGRFLCTLEVKYADPTLCNCGWQNMRRIVGGVETKVNEYPMMAGLINLSTRDLFCGATIVASRYAVSAAHCFKDVTAAIVALLVGEHDISTGTDTSSTRLKRVLTITTHEQYDDSKGLNDIAVIKTIDPIEFNFDVGPACLPFYYYQNSFDGEKVEALGWGTTEFTGPKSDVLLKTDLDVLDQASCNNSVGGTMDQMCTYRQGHDACQSDSGGPLLWSSNSRLYLVGVISSGYGCATSRPALSTRVTSYLMWITSNMPDATFCVKGP